MKQPRFFH